MKNKAMDMIFINLKAENNQEVLTTLGTALFTGGYVDEGYINAVISRESKFPTGLNIDGNIKVAIPHADSCYVNEGQIVFASLENPVKFNNIENPEMQLDVNLVFMLAIKDPNKQAETLQKLMGMFENKDTLKQLTQCVTQREAKIILEKELN